MKNNKYLFLLFTMFFLPPFWGGLGWGLAQTTTGYIVKGGPDTGSFSGGVFIGTTSKINYAANEQRILIDSKPGIAEGSWKDVTGITQSTISLTKIAPDGWGNAGAASNSVLDTLENGWVQYKVNNLSATLAVGFSTVNTDAHYNSINYAIMIDAGQLYIYKQGQLSGSFGAVSLNDTIRITRIANVLLYTKNNELLYNQELDAKVPLMADVALYTQGVVLEMKSSFATLINRCEQAISFTNTNSSLSNNTNESESWFRFVADSTTIVIQQTRDSASTDYIQRMELYSGDCSNLVLIDTSEVVMPYINVLTLIERNLTIGSPYYLRALKSGTGNVIFNVELRSILQQTPCPSCAPAAISQTCDLVCNGNFEYYTALPSGLGDNAGYDPIGGICSWQNGSLNGTSDYYNQNTTAVGVDVPVNYNGTQASMSSGAAKAYAGIIAWNSSSFWGNNYHEYITQKLISPLLAGHTYRATMWVSLADKSSAATDNLGMYFTNSSTYLSAVGGYGLIAPSSSQIVLSPSGTYLNDITQWKKITGTIVGTGEQWLTIGCFNNNIQYVNNPSSVSGRGAYYYIDEVSIIEEDPNFSVTQGTSICQGQSETLTAIGAISYLWAPGGATTSSITVSPVTTTTYTVIGTDVYGCQRTLTTTIEVYPRPQLNTAAQSICLGESAILFAFIPGGGTAQFTWNPGLLPNLSSVSPLTTTTYTVTESIHGCTNTEIITVKPLPTVTVSPATATICVGNSIALTASGATSYTWAPPSSGLSSYIIANPTATPAVNTTYTVTGTSSVTNCKNTATVSITVTQSAVVNPVANISVSGCNTFIPATVFTSVPGGATYTWTNSNPTIGLPASGTGNLPAFTALNTSGTVTTATITVTPTLNGCPGVATAFTITIIPCCVATGSQAHTFVNGNNAANFYFTYGATATGANIAFNGTFVVSNNITLANCEVRLGTDAIIQIKSGFTLFITSNSHLAACNNMWDKILIEPGGYLIVDKNSLIEDAKTAVYSMNGGKYLLYQARLNRNYKHMELTAYSGQHPGSVTRSTFTCELIPNGASAYLKPPYNGQRTEVGIEINNVDNVQIGTNSGSNVNQLANTFKNMNTGIRAGQSSVTVYNNKFTGMSNGLAPNTGIAAIVAVGDLDAPPNYTARNLIVGDDSPNGLNTFTNCVNGVVAFFNMNASVRWNDFSGINAKGVYVFANQQHNNLTIESNKFTSITTQGGIAIHSMNNRSGTNPPSLTRIQFNEINNVNKGAGVLVEELNNQTTGALYVVFNNKISGVQYGVRARNLSNATVSNNYIQTRRWYAHPQPSIGIEVTGSYGTRVRSNSIKTMPNPTTDTKHGGIYISLSPNSTVNCNITESMGFGIKCAGQMPSDIYNNTIRRDFYGFWLDNNGFIGVQDGVGTAGFPSYNKWVNIPVPGYTATSKRTFTSNGTNGFNSPIVYKNNAGVILNPLYNPNPTGASASIPFTLTPTTNGNPASPSCTIAQFHRSTFSNLLKHAQDIALENISFPGNDANGKWLSKQGLLVNIKTDSIDVSSDGILQTFVNQAAADNMGKLTELNTIINDPAKYNTTDMTAAQVLNASIVPVNDIETNQKLLNEMIINNYLTNIASYTTAQIGSLRTLANKCPFTDGLAVYQARVMLSGIDSLGTEYANACETADDASRILYTNALTEDNTALTIYPNPASGQVTITYIIEPTDEAVIEIYNLIGEKVAIQFLDADATEQTFSVALLNSGVYLYKYSINGKVIKSDKLVIVK